MIFRHIEEKAETVLRNNGFYEVGFDIKSLTHKMGITLINKMFDSDISGLLVLQDGNPVISINHREDTKRQRFTVAHEIGHYILHAKNQPLFIDKNPKIMFRNNASSTGEILIEREANAFAAALLMPAELVREEVSKIPNTSRDAVKHLSEQFLVSEQAMSFRLSNLGYYLASY